MPLDTREKRPPDKRPERTSYEKSNRIIRSASGHGLRRIRDLCVGAADLVAGMRVNVVGILIGVMTVISFLMIAGIRVDAKLDELESWYSYLEYVCEQKDICPELVQAIIETESNWYPEARNGDCVGLMQISEKWHQDRMERLGVTDLTDPYDNILVGVDYLAELFRRYEDPVMVLMLYNGDSRAWKFWETGEMSKYAARILDRAAELERG